MKVYWCRPAPAAWADDEQEHRVIRAESVGQAKASWANEIGAMFVEARATRLPAFDDRPVTDRALIGLGWWLECNRCYRRVSQTDFDDPLDGRTPLYGPHDEVYCSEECANAAI